MNTRSARHMESIPRLEDLIFDKIPVSEIATALGVSLSTAKIPREMTDSKRHKK